MRRRHLHFVGIKGVGMAPLAIIAKEAGFIVSGCDIPEEFITDEPLKKAGIFPIRNFSANHMDEVDLVITTGAHGGFDNPEVKAAKNKKIMAITQGEAVGYFMSGKLFNRTDIQGISVAGSHGKTTTTAMIATLLINSDPSYVVGTGSIVPLGLPGHYGKGRYFIAEADEYVTEPVYDKTVKFIWQHPHIIVITNIEFDHPDVFSSVEDLADEFLKFVEQVPANGFVVANGDDHQVRKILARYKGRSVTYGFSPNNDYVIDRTYTSGDNTFFWLSGQGAELGEFTIKVSGEYNAVNATAAVVVGLEEGMSIGKIKKSLRVFGGVKRRFELLGVLPSGALLYDDYAHHPTEIKKTLSAFKKRFPNKKIVCIFQPHTYSRTKKLFDDFSRSFSEADVVGLVNIFASSRETDDKSVSSLHLARAMANLHRDVKYLGEADNVVKYITQNRLDENTVVVLMGAGDIYKVGSHIELKDRE